MRSGLARILKLAVNLVAAQVRKGRLTKEALNGLNILNGVAVAGVKSVAFDYVLEFRQ